jgi:hypothetical protein
MAYPYGAQETIISATPYGGVQETVVSATPYGGVQELAPSKLAVDPKIITDIWCRVRLVQRLRTGF